VSQTALITGGSSGISLALSRKLAARGWRLLWVSLDEDELVRASAALRSTFPDLSLETLALDLSDTSAPSRVLQWAQGHGGIDLLVNNAGFGLYRNSKDLPLEGESKMIAVNVSALHALTRLFIAPLEDRGGGTIVNIASNSAFTPVPFMATYASTKAFVHHYAMALDEELRLANSPVRCMTVRPAAAGDTQFAKTGQMDHVRTFRSFTQTSAEEIARDILRGLDQGNDRIVTGAAMRWSFLLMKFTPSPMLRFITRWQSSAVNSSKTNR
jgi:short-subunit dehydrogenase